MNKWLVGCLCILCLTASFSILWFARQWQVTNESIRSAVSELQSAVSENRPHVQTSTMQIKTILQENAPFVNSIVQNAKFASKDVRDGALDLRVAVKAQREEWESPEYKKWRRDGFRFGEQATQAVVKITEHVTTKTLPEFDALIQEHRNLAISMRTLTDEIHEVAKQAKVDSAQISIQIIDMLRTGEATVEQIRKAMTSDEIKIAIDYANGILKDIKDTTVLLAPSVQQILDMLKTAKAWQKPLLIGQLILSLAKLL